MTSVGHLDFLELLDQATRGDAADITTGYDVYLLAGKAGLAVQQATVARWVGELVTTGYVEVLGVVGRGRPLPPRGATWTDDDLQRGYRFTVTAPGRTEAANVRRRQREQGTDEAVGARYPLLAHAWLLPEQRASLAASLRELVIALDDERPSAAVGGARDLMESALRIAVRKRTGEPASPRANLSALFSAALPDTPSPSKEADAVKQIGRGLGGTVTAIGRLRNAAGTGHGRGEPVEVDMKQARFAAAAACAVAEYVLSARAAE